MSVVSQIDEQFASTAIRNVKVRHGYRATSVGNDGARASRLVDREFAAGSAGAVKAELNDKIGSVKTRAVVEFSVYNVDYVRYCLEGRFGKELEGDGAESCIDNKEVRHGSAGEIGGKWMRGRSIPLPSFLQVSLSFSLISTKYDRVDMTPSNLQDACIKVLELENLTRLGKSTS